MIVLFRVLKNHTENGFEAHANEKVLFAQPYDWETLERWEGKERKICLWHLNKILFKQGKVDEWILGKSFFSWVSFDFIVVWSVQSWYKLDAKEMFALVFISISWTL